ncbi:hypothetical protein LT679_12240 [Mucilaginibacter roseus]|uniref:Uncharacterized protein n=1 Tax=Mucilaginibacter roseus TaxID=1528868 RepID=A0ABS8U6W5_9SPHI|nr:hypothetical protein [Mucilaginibacter roseus]MCD8741376.1 hypothetical protein [Mucilaginibacter roseus]
MTKPANDHQKPSPSDTPTDRPNDNGGEAVKKKEDKVYKEDQPQQENIAKQHEKEEQPVDPVKTPPAEEGMDKGQVQPD